MIQSDPFVQIGFNARRRTGGGLLAPFVWLGGLIATAIAVTVGAVLAVLTAAAACGEGAHSFQDHASLAAALRADLRAGVRCLVKGSRGSAMDRIVAALLSTGEDTPHVA